MVHNPIYDGPVYDSVQPQFRTPTVDKLQAIATNSSSPTCTHTSPPIPNNSVCYFDQSSPHPSQSFSHSLLGDNNSQCSTSVSVPAVRAMALKKNGKERNKLHLSLTLDGYSAGNAASYMVMSPLPSVPGSLKAGMIELSPEDTEKYNE